MTAAWSDRAHPFQPGTRWPYHPSGLAGRVRQTGRTGRVKDFSNRRGAFAAQARELGLQSVAGAPIIVDGTVWGLVTIASTHGPLPDQTEDRLAEFTELLGTAIANTQSRADCPLRGPGSSPPRTRRGGASSVTCTTVFSSVWSRSR